MDLDQYDDSQSDSGVSVDLSPNSMSDNETPIEREIRLAFKREQSLRRARGLDETKEFIEIPFRKSILTQHLPNKSVKHHGKERQFAGNKMQREIHAEAERETALVKLRRLPGFYDKGTVGELQEKKLLFETFQDSKDLQTQERVNNVEILFQSHSAFPPAETSPRNQDTFRTVPEPKNAETSCTSSGTILNGDKQERSSEERTKHTRLDSSPQLFPSLKEKKLLFESLREKKDVQISREKDIEFSGAVQERRKSLDLFFRNQNPGIKTVQEPKDLGIKRNVDDKITGISKETTIDLQLQSAKECGPGFSEAVNRQVIIIESNPTVIPHTNRKIPHSDSTHTALTEPETPRVRCSAEELQRNSRVQNDEKLQENPFFKLRSSESLLQDVHKDIQEAQRREQELHKQRASLYGNRSKVTTSQSRTTPTHIDANTSGRNVAVPPVSSSFGKLDLTWPPPSLQNEQKTQSEVKELRQTNLLIQRWEAGLINRHDVNHDD